MAEFPWTKERIREAAEPLREKLREGPTALLADAERSVQRTREARQLEETFIPFYFELWPASGQNSGDNFVHSYDGSGRLVLVQRTNQYGRKALTVFVHGDSKINYWTIKEWRGSQQVERAGEICRGNELGHDISLMPPSDVVAYVWTYERGKPSALQVWNLRQAQPMLVQSHYEGELLTRLERDGKTVWPLPKKRPMDPLETVAGQILARVRVRLKATSEPILALTVCFELGNSRFQPPQVGVIFRSDAEAFAKNPEAYAKDANALLSPTLQEDYPFPMRTRAFFVTLSEEDGIHLSWKDDELLPGALALVDLLNELRQHGEPPFILVDMENDSTVFLQRLKPDERAQLAAYGIEASPTTSVGNRLVGRSRDRRKDK